MTLRLTKHHGLGNDFLVVFHPDVDDPAALAVALNGLIVLFVVSSDRLRGWLDRRLNQGAFDTETAELRESNDDSTEQFDSSTTAGGTAQ